MHRRHFLRSGALAAATLGAAPLLAHARRGAALAPPAPSLPVLPAPHPAAAFAPLAPLAPIRASADRIVALHACTRPFRAQGPRIEAERIGRKTVIHNYGHGGSGWSLSWGAAAIATQLARATGQTQLAVIGCGAIGLTTALVAQRAGLRVRIYARERPPQVRSSFATGVWSPDSRVCTSAYATPEFARRWEQMARTSFGMYQNLLGLPGDPIEWRDGYVLSDVPFDQPGGHGGNGEPDYPPLEAQYLADLGPHSQPLAASQHPFPVAHVRRYTQLVFNISAYARLLLDDFLVAGGEIETRDFASPRQFAALREKTLVNATGYGARALLGDDSLVPVRGQTARLVPQPEVGYGLVYRGHNLNVVPRRDGILVQAQADGDFGNADATPDRAASEAAVARLAALFA
ncbi:FAD-dependent oxidoreductase [Xanthomonas hyacinthi]|uniref:D-amino-acid oxidase n=1 Tax=Xanthomonas hyacinthi TaxID=56455 RepID=A0A2S7EWC0_9XANT|nr:FAD-dependent oxidoreductase [Xanthomonas hyacinthi]KLD74144.1 D-amino acid oxidase [Xanthomonas hyacinthi DSM 19077]PPU97467.1 FAD-binding oxidoreductase [Xanthomonas hyacinthi]QGY77262.1 FAD-dependent oxidoreductase [Xanthomonas hyacinthi]